MSGRPPSPEEQDPLRQLVRSELPGADDDTVTIVVAIAGLLAAVAYADRDVTQQERASLQEQLERIEGLETRGVQAVLHALESQLLRIATTETPRFLRGLRACADHDLRVEVLKLLVEMAASDGRITLNEVNILRQMTGALGLSQDDYNAIQSHYKAKLSFLGHP